MPTSDKNNPSFFSDLLRVKGVTIEKLAQTTGISERFLELLFSEQYDKLPAAPYIHGYILKIAEVLGMDGEELWREYQRHTHTIRRSGEHDRLPQNRFSPVRANKKMIVFGVIAFVILIYIAFRIPSFLGKPSLSLDMENNTVVSTSTFVISGSTSPKNTLTINNETVYPDTKGNFSKNVELSPGFNTFTFTVKRLLGGEETTVRQVFYKPTSTSTPTKSP